MPHYPFSSKDDLKKSCLKNIHFGRVVVWYGVNWKIIQMFRSNYSAKCQLFHFHPFCSNHPDAKSVVRQGINSVPQTEATTFAIASV